MYVDKRHKNMQYLFFSSASSTGGKPAVKLSYPVLQRVDRNYADDPLSRSVSQEDVNEGNDLECLAQPHRVGKNATKAVRTVKSLQRLDDIVEQKAYTTNLGRRRWKVS